MKTLRKIYGKLIKLPCFVLLFVWGFLDDKFFKLLLIRSVDSGFIKAVISNGLGSGPRFFFGH